MMRPRLAIDLDNTIACYDDLFVRLASERSIDLAGVAPRKTAVQRRLCETGRESLWTELQGEAYGPRMVDAAPFPGVADFLARCREGAVEVFIVSHRSRAPYSGRGHDLHQAARSWLEARGWIEPERIFLEPTIADKVSRICALGCTHLIDDLVSVLQNRALPETLVRILFDPHREAGQSRHFTVIESWPQADRLLGL